MGVYDDWLRADAVDAVEDVGVEVKSSTESEVLSAFPVEAGAISDSMETTMDCTDITGTAVVGGNDEMLDSSELIEAAEVTIVTLGSPVGSTVVDVSVNCSIDSSELVDVWKSSMIVDSVICDVRVLGPVCVIKDHAFASVMVSVALEAVDSAPGTSSAEVDVSEALVLGTDEDDELDKVGICAFSLIVSVELSRRHAIGGELLPSESLGPAVSWAAGGVEADWPGLD